MFEQVNVLKTKPQNEKCVNENIKFEAYAVLFEAKNNARLKCLLRGILKAQV
jgi:hypothetical protein